MFGGRLLVLILVYGLAAAALFGVVYAAVRLGAFHAMKAHTRWVDRGKP